MKYINFKRYKFSTIFKFIDLRRYKFRKVSKYLDISQYNFNRAGKFPILKKQYYIDCFKKIKNINKHTIIYFTDTAQKWIKDSLLPLYNNSILLYNPIGMST